MKKDLREIAKAVHGRTIEQIAKTLNRMNSDELKNLELLLDKKTTGKILKRRKEARAGKTISIRDMKSLKNL